MPLAVIQRGKDDMLSNRYSYPPFEDEDTKIGRVTRSEQSRIHLVPFTQHFRSRQSLLVSHSVMPICSGDRDQRQRKASEMKCYLQWVERQKGKQRRGWGPPGCLNNEREKRNVCFPILINLGNKSENMAKHGSHRKEMLRNFAKKQIHLHDWSVWLTL